MYTAQVLETSEDIKKLFPEWDSLLSRGLTKTVFQTPLFQDIWWKTLGVGKRIFIIIRNEKHALVGLAPIFLEESNGIIQLSLLGCVNVSDYLDVLIDDSVSENQEQIYGTLFSALEKLEWKKLFWCSLPEISKTRLFLKKYFANKGKINESIQDVVPIIHLPKTWDEYLDSAGRKQRHEIRRKQRKLDSTPHEYTVLDDPNQSDVDDFIDLHKQSSQNKKEFWDDRHLIFFQALVHSLKKEKRIKLFFLSIRDERVASMLAFDEPESLALYNSGFVSGTYDELSVGSNLIAYTIRYAIEEKKKFYDFLRGGEKYKFRFGAVSTNIYDIEITRP